MKFGSWRLLIPAMVAMAISAGATLIADTVEAQAPPTMQAGKWRTTTQFSSIDIPGIPAQVRGMVTKQMGKPQSYEYCLKPEDIGRPGPDALGGKNAKDCHYEDWDYANGRMRAVLVCTIKGQGRLRQVMSGTGSPTNYSANVDTTITGGKMGAMRMKGTVTGQRLGGC